MPKKAKPTKPRVPAAKKKTRKNVLETRLAALADKLNGLSGRLARLEDRAPVPGPRGDPGPQGRRGPIGEKGEKGEPEDSARLDALERRIAELEKQLATPKADAV